MRNLLLMMRVMIRERYRMGCKGNFHLREGYI